MATVQDLINDALIEIGELDPNETPATEESNHGFRTLNRMLGSWNAQGLPIYQLTRETIALTGAASYPLTTRPVKIRAAAVSVTSAMTQPLQVVDAAGWAAFFDKPTTADFGMVLYYEHGHPLGKIHLAPTPATGGTLEILSRKPAGGDAVIQIRDTHALTGAASYTIGPGGTINVAAPLEVLSASISATSTVTRPVELVAAEAWAAFPRKGDGGAFAEVLWYDSGYPTGTVYIAPKPGAGTLELYSLRALAAFGSLAETINLPEGYEHALMTNLALLLAKSYGRPIAEADVATANDAKVSIQGLNASVLGEPQPATKPEAA